jgi:MOSC domain-containing protein YiiM
MTVRQIRAGRIREFPGPKNSGSWRSAIAKVPVAGSVAIGPLGIVGDEQADRRYHGGPDKAVLCYASEWYAEWTREFGGRAPAPGTLGENFEIEEGNEHSVCLGDIYGAADVEFEVSQPRQPCWKPGALHGLPNLAARILKTGRTGWYLRVRTPGSLAASCKLALLDRPHPEWTVFRASQVRHFSKDAAQLASLRSVPSLSESWKK